MLRHLEPTYAYQLDSTERPPSCHGALANLDGRGRGLTDDSLSSTTELGSFQQALVVSAACSSSSSLSERSNSHGDVGVVANPGTPVCLLSISLVGCLHLSLSVCLSVWLSISMVHHCALCSLCSLPLCSSFGRNKKTRTALAYGRREESQGHP